MVCDDDKRASEHTSHLVTFSSTQVYERHASDEKLVIQSKLSPETDLYNTILKEAIFIIQPKLNPK